MSEAGSVIVKIVANDQELKTVLAQDVAALKGFATAGGDAGRQLGQELDAGVRKFRPGTQEAIDQVARLGLTVIENTGKVSWGFTHASDAATLLAHSTAGVATLAGPTFSQMAVAAERARDSLTATVLAARQAADGVEGVGEASESLPELGQRTEQAREVLMGMRAEIDKLLPSLQGVGEGGVVFKTLQQGIDESLGLVNRDINSARESASVFAKDFKTATTSVEQDMVKLGQTSAQMQARVGVSFRTLQQGIDASMGLIDRPLNSAAASARVFEQSFLGSTPVVESAGRAAEEAGHHVEGAGHRVHAMSGQIRGATQAWSNFGRMIGMGEVVELPARLAHIAAEFAHVNLMMLGGVGAAFAFVGAIAYIATEAQKDKSELLEIKLGADVAGNVEITAHNVELLREQIGELKGTTEEDTKAAIDAFSKLQFTSEAAFVGMTSATALWAATNNSTMAEVSKSFVGLIEKEVVSSKELFSVFGQLTLAQQQEFQAAKESGDQHRVMAAILDIVADKTGHLRDQTIEAKEAASGFFDKLVVGIPFVEGMSESLDRQRGIWNALAGSIRNTTPELDTFIDKARLAIALGQQASESISTPVESIEKLYEQQAKIVAGMDAAKATKSGEELAAFLRDQQDDLTKINKDIAAAQKAPLTEEYNEYKLNEDLKVSKAKDTKAAKVQSLRETLDYAKRTFGEESEEAKRAAIELNTTLKAQAPKAQGAAAAGRFDISETKQRISEINANEALGVEERGRLIRAEYEGLLANGKLTAQQRVQIQTEMNNALAANAKKGAAERNTIEKDNLDTDLRLAQIRMRSERDTMQIAVGEKRATNAQKLELDLKAAAEEGEIQLELLNKEQELYREGSAEFARLENEKRVLKAETAAEFARINAQIAANERKVARDAGNTWTSAADSIAAAERSMLGDMFSGRVTFLQSLGRATAQFLQRELEDTLIYFTKKMLLSETEFAFEEAKLSKGVLVHLLGEGSKTAATVTGAGIRTGAETAAAATSMGVSTAMGSAQIANDAKKAAAGAYSAVSEIPVVGPVLAPIAAGAAFVAVMAFNTLTGLDVGAWNVPRDMPAFIHKGESVIPKNFAEGLRERGALTNNTSGNSTATFHYRPTINAPASKSLEQMLSDDGRMLRAWFNAQVRNGALKLSPG
jgi:hypothetical protein